MALKDNLRAAYKLDDVNDYSGNGYTLTNNNTVTFVSGLIGNCAHMVSGNNWLGIINDIGIAEGANWSVSFFCRTPDNTGDFALFQLIYGSSNYHQVDTNWVGSLGKFHVVPYNSTMLEVAHAFNNNTWYHIVVVNSGGTITLYINTVSQGTATLGTGKTALRANRFELALTNQSSYLNGDIDLLYIWNRAITTNEIATLYNSGNGCEFGLGQTYVRAVSVSVSNAALRISSLFAKIGFRPDTKTVSTFSQDNRTGTATLSQDIKSTSQLTLDSRH